jgi:hypothetical protein
MALNSNSFSKCAPSISTNIKQCGSVTLCNAVVLESDQLTSAYMASGNYRVMEALLHHEMEIKMCEVVQNGLYDFLMSNKVNLSKRISSTKVNSGLVQIAPFVMARQFSPINNKYWNVSAGQSSSANWSVIVTSSTNIPADVRSFPAGLRVFIESKTAGGSKSETAWSVVSATDNSDNTLTLILAPQNSGSNLPAGKIANPVTGLLTRGTPNISDYEKFCNEMPAYLNWKNVPFWTETTRTSMCKSDLYDQYRALLLADNPLYREFGDLDDIQKNKQLAQDWQERLVSTMFKGKPLPNQGLATIDSLEDIDTYDGSTLGVDGAKCVGKRANAVGIYEQLAECNRIADLQGQQLNLPALFVALYNIIRVRQANGQPVKSIDMFTDSTFAEQIHLGMLAYFNSKTPGGNSLRVTVPVGGDVVGLNLTEVKDANFGFAFRSYKLSWPNVTINVITHNFFDDYISASQAADQGDTARVLWVLDFTGIYPGILASNRMVAKTGDLKTLAAVNPSFACVMKVPTQEQTLTSMTWTMVVECPASNLILENIAFDVPEAVNRNNISYPAAS